MRIKSSRVFELLDFFTHTSRRIVINFHRVSNDMDIKKNPFNRLASISPVQLDVFIRLMKLRAKFVDLDSLLTIDEKRPFYTYLHLTFDDISTSFMENAVPIIEKHRIPITIFPSAGIAGEGFSWRDKIYYIMADSELLQDYIRKANEVYRPAHPFSADMVYSLSKSSKFNQKQMEYGVISSVLDSSHDDFLANIKEFKPYLNWKELRNLRNHSWVTIGNHGNSHYNYNSLSELEIEEDLLCSHKKFKDSLGFTPQHFAIPFGEIGQRSFLTVDKVLKELGYKTVGWGKTVNNPLIPLAGIKHYFRIDGVSHFFINTIKLAKASIRTQYYPLSGVPFSYYEKHDDRVECVRDVSHEEYKTFFRRIQPQKIHHQLDDYIDHLYNKNPHRDNDPVHLAIKVNDTIFSMGSLFYIPFILSSTEKKGAYFCGWFRFPELPSQSVRSRKIFEEAKRLNSILGVYYPSSNSLHFYQDWDRVKMFRLAFKKSLRKVHSLDFTLTDRWDIRLQHVIDRSQRNLILSIKRGPGVYEWRIEQYPLCRFSYLLPERSVPDWYIIFCLKEKTMYISDFGLAELNSEDLAAEMIDRAFLYGGSESVNRIILETSNEVVRRAAQKSGFQIIKTFINVYKHPNMSGKVIPWDQVHETQISGDLLPRFLD